MAKRKLPTAVFDHVDCAAGDEQTVRENEAAFRSIHFRPRAMVDVSERTQRRTVLGRTIEMPVILGPGGVQRMVHRDGEVAAARAATRMGTIYTLGTAASCSIEEVADAAKGGTLWFQLYLWRSRDLVRSLVERAERAGYHALVLTIDSKNPGRRDRDLRNGVITSRPRTREAGGHARLSAFPEIRAEHIVDALRHPGWLLRHYLFAPPITFKNVTAEDARYANASWVGPGEIQRRINEAATWEEIRFLRQIWRGPLVLKGILTGEDACLAFDNGADAVIVSNHGGRFLDGLPATFDALPRVVEAAGTRNKEVLIDGGVRRGSDVIKALAVGARACLIARPFFYALAADGERGVVTLLDLLKREIDSCLGALGCPNIDMVDRDVLDETMPPWRTSVDATIDS
ncbi:MAG: alpha-hydroxy-acid oxidizing protein [Chloroflexota bacterium]|nr:alpha-hydroxy-acid oxidizing protein [Chloroflexota bacterium]